MITERGGRRSLPKQVEAVPVSAEVLDDARRELEPGPELPVLEEDVRVPQTRGVEVLSLALLREDAVHALDQADLFEGPDLTVARSDGDPVPLADFLRADLPLVGGEEDLGAVLVGQKLRGLQRRHRRRVVARLLWIFLHRSRPLSLTVLIRSGDI